MAEPRLTLQGLKVLACFMQNPRRDISGADIARETSLASGTLYPILIRFEQAGWLGSDWEDGQPAKLGRPKRRFYRITGAGQTAYNLSLAEFAPGSLSWAR